MGHKKKARSICDFSRSGIMPPFTLAGSGPRAYPYHIHVLVLNIADKLLAGR